MKKHLVSEEGGSVEEGSSERDSSLGGDQGGSFRSKPYIFQICQVVKVINFRTYCCIEGGQKSNN